MNEEIERLSEESRRYEIDREWRIEMENGVEVTQLSWTDFFARREEQDKDNNNTGRPTEPPSEPSRLEKCKGQLELALVVIFVIFILFAIVYWICKFVNCLLFGDSCPSSAELDAAMYWN